MFTATPPFSHYERYEGQSLIPTASALKTPGLIKIGDFSKNAQFKSYGVKHERKNHADKQWLTFARSAYCMQTHQKSLREKQRLHRCFEDCPIIQLACFRARNEPDDRPAHIIRMRKYYWAEGLHFSAFSLCEQNIVAGIIYCI